MWVLFRREPIAQNATDHLRDALLVQARLVVDTVLVLWQIVEVFEPSSDHLRRNGSDNLILRCFAAPKRGGERSVGTGVVEITERAPSGSLLSPSCTASCSSAPSPSSDCTSCSSLNAPRVRNTKRNAAAQSALQQRAISTARRLST